MGTKTFASSALAVALGLAFLVTRTTYQSEDLAVSPPRPGTGSGSDEQSNSLKQPNAVAVRGEQGLQSATSDTPAARVGLQATMQENVWPESDGRDTTILGIPCRIEWAGDRRLLYTHEGQLIHRGQYINGRHNGLHEMWFASGGVRYIGEYINKSKEGLWMYYRESGLVHERLNISKGKNHGECEIFYENGTTKSVGRYNMNRRVGEWTFFRHNGDLNKTKSGWYEDDHLVSSNH